MKLVGFAELMSLDSVIICNVQEDCDKISHNLDSNLNVPDIENKLRQSATASNISDIAIP